MRTADQWADACRVLPAGSAEPGPWRSSRVPFMVPVMRAASDPRYRRIVVCCGAQMSKTESLLNIIGHKLDDDPAPILYVAPTQRQVESISSSRVMKMLSSCPSLLEKLDKTRAGNKVGEKYIAGQRLGFAWAGSATELSSHPAALVLVDERDRMTADVDGEGDPVGLAEARTATYPDGKVIIASTPTLEGGSPIWALYLEGTQYRWSWPCPDCFEYFVPEFTLLKWPEKSSPQQALRGAKVACPHCGSLIGDEHRQPMNAAGRFETAGNEDSDTASFWISGLASPWRSFGQAAKAFVEAAHSGSQERVQTITNTVFGELYKLAGDAPAWESVAKLRGEYAMGSLPEGVLRITCGVDVQGDRLVFAVRGWGYSSESWLLEHGELFGETEHEPVWTQLANLLDVDYGGRRIDRMLVDSGYRPGGARTATNQVYAFARRFAGRVLPTKGHDVGDKPLWLSKIDVTFAGKVHKHGLSLMHIDTNYFKAWLYGRIDWPADQPGAWHLPNDATDDYCQQVVSEQRIVKPTGRVVWIRTRTANHYLDAEILNCAGAHLIGIHRAQRKPAKADQPPAQPVVQNGWPDRRRPPSGRRNWVTQW
jgi:phage terminase large subunit GpA-like protein